MTEETPTPAATPPQRFGDRYEILSRRDHGAVEVADREPWRKCWSCGSTRNQPEENYCVDCGGSIEPRKYRGVVSPTAAPHSMVLLSTLQDAAIQALIPPIWDTVSLSDWTLLIFQDSNITPVKPPLTEQSALLAARALVRALERMHAQRITMGPLGTNHLGLRTPTEPVLWHVPGARRLAEDEDTKLFPKDVRDMATLLELLTVTPRTTRRLEDDDLDELFRGKTVEEPVFAPLLRDVRTNIVIGAPEMVIRVERLVHERAHPEPLVRQVGSLTDTGIVRAHNEDSFFVLDMGMRNAALDGSWGLFIVADGMGGHDAGEIASGLAIRGVTELILRDYLSTVTDAQQAYDSEKIKRIMREAVEYANRCVMNEAQARGNDMGTTLTIALVIGDRLVVANVGDSRAYFMREGKLKRITKDHSLVQRLVDLGQISDDDVYSHPQRNAILRSIGDRADVEVDVFAQRILPGDVVLLCSDGQWEMTRDPDMAHIISSNEDPQTACIRLIEAANRAGGEDNITAVIVRFSEM